MELGDGGLAENGSLLLGLVGEEGEGPRLEIGLQLLLRQDDRVALEFR